MHEEMNESELHGDRGSRRSVRNGIIGVACAVVLLPVIVLVWQRMSRTTASAHDEPATQMSQGATSLATLEEKARTNPNATNRLNLSLAYINAGEPGRAPAVLHDLLAAEPNNVAAWNNLCVAHIELHELEPALDECGRAVSLDPKYGLARNNLRWAESERQAESDALAKMEQTPPGSRDTAYFLAQGMHYLHLGNYDAAINSWQRVLLIDTRNASAANNIGTALMMKKQPEVAQTWFERAISWDPGMQIAKNNLAWAESEEQKPVR